MRSTECKFTYSGVIVAADVKHVGKAQTAKCEYLCSLEHFRKENGEWVADDRRIQIVKWAENDPLPVGSRVTILGDVKVDEWTWQGKQCSKTVLVADSIEVTGKASVEDQLGAEVVGDAPVVWPGEGSKDDCPF